MRWISRMLDLWRSRTEPKAARRAREALQDADHKAREIDRIAGEVSAGGARLNAALRRFELALQGRGR
ncbi:hypothetical protein [Hansschlegelia sp.]|uniref:hypothetical protein n=1 Tax=Hansschlegelia sp. TaxID=2041892 RepID=UPI002CFEB314|nr:hypothetical protein [Hansschlegelia sp.]HVI28881.1 hypothetical protein [Hansschlegelia sp.]